MIERDVRVESPLGPLHIVVAAGAVVAVEMEEGAPAPQVVARGAPAEDPVLAEAHRQLAQWFAGERVGFDLPLGPRGTPFQIAVWRALAEIPYGETRTYAEIAARVGRPSASRAVGAANARNPIAIVVPCHRVIGAGGALTGYAGGIERKRWLLEHERSVLARRACGGT